MKPLNTPSSWPKAIIETLEDYDFDSQPLLDDLGIDFAELNDADALIDQDAVTRLWNQAALECNDDAFGIRAGLKVHAHAYPTVGYSLMSCETLKSSCERLFRYQRILAQGLEFQFEKNDEEYRLTFAIKADQLEGSIYAVDGALSSFLNFVRWLTHGNVTPLRATLCRQQPSHKRVFDDLFNCPIHYNAHSNSLYFSETAMAYALPTAHKAFSKIHDDKANQALLQLKAGSFSEQVRDLIISKLPSGEPKQGQLAQTLHISSSTLKRRLQSEATTFKLLLDSTRKHLAMNYLHDNTLSLTEITYLLGFSENSAFNRAFKRWQGTTPSRWRQQHT